MEIRIINSKGELMNVSRLSLKVSQSSLIGIDEAKNVVNVETFESEEVAKNVLKTIVFAIWGRHADGDSDKPVIINLNEEYRKEFEANVEEEEKRKEKKSRGKSK